jgi:hypothetical protein
MAARIDDELSTCAVPPDMPPHGVCKCQVGPTRTRTRSRISPAVISRAEMIGNHRTSVGTTFPLRLTPREYDADPCDLLGDSGRVTPVSAANLGDRPRARTRAISMNDRTPRPVSVTDTPAGEVKLFCDARHRHDDPRMG